MASVKYGRSLFCKLGLYLLSNSFVEYWGLTSNFISDISKNLRFQRVALNPLPFAYKTDSNLYFESKNVLLFCKIIGCFGKAVNSVQHVMKDTWSQWKNHLHIVNVMFYLTLTDLSQNVYL